MFANRSVIRTIIRYYSIIVTHNDHFLVKQYKQFMYTYLSNQALSALQRMSPSLLLSQNRLSLPAHHVTWDAWTASYVGGLAWLFLAWLPQILLLIKVPDLNTYIIHRYSSQLKQHKVYHSNYIHAQALYIHIVWLVITRIFIFCKHFYLAK